MSKALDILYGGKPLTPRQAEQYLPYKARKIREMAANGEFGPSGAVFNTVARGRRTYTTCFIYPTAIDAWIRNHSKAA